MNKLDVQNAILNAMTPYLDDDQLYQLKNTLEETRLSVGKRTKICVKKNENLCQKFCAATAEDGRNGKWSKGPGRKLTDAMTEVLGDTRVIVEDIGPKGGLPGVKKLKTKTGWPGIKILMFAFDDDTANEHLPHNYQDTNMVVYAGTHDNETIVGYFRDKSDYELAYLYEYLNIHYKEEIPDALIRAAYASIADVAIIQMQDLMKLGNEARMNAPSTVGRNWRWRIGKDTLSEERRAWIRTLATVYRR